jgi:glycine/D-amino acid oxidase-like deaminating enzyme
MHTDHQPDERYFRTQSFWLDSLPEPLLPRASLDGDRTADVVIVGGGFTGLWTAFYLKRHAPALDIVILEAEIAGFGASGRNGGWASAYLAGIEPMAANPALREGALRLQRLMIETLPEMERVTRVAGIDCDFEQSGHLAVAVLPAQLERLKAHVLELQHNGFSEADCHYLSASELAGHIHVAGALGGFFMAHCAAIHPARLVRGLARAVEQQGVRIYERTPVISLPGDRVQTPHGAVRADRTLLATEGYTGSLPGLKRKLIPIHSMMVATEPLNDDELDQVGLRRRSTFNNVQQLVTYGQLTADRRLAFGCRGQYLFGARVKRSFEASEPAFDVARQELLKFFPFLRSKRFTHAWGGALGVSRNLAPAVCFDRERGLGWAGGYFGDGVTASSLAGRTLADLVLGRDTERTHTPWVNPERTRHLDRGLWEPEPVRWLGVQLRTRWMGWTDQAERRRSRLAPFMNWALDKVFP